MTDMSVIIYDNINLKTGKLNYIDKYGKYKVLTKSGNHFGKLQQYPLKVNIYVYVYYPEIPVFDTYPTQIHTAYLAKYMYNNIHSSTICNSQKMETTETSMNNRVDK